MKILAICQYYAPEPYPIADSCEELIKRGHDVHVVVGVPNYPMGYIYSEFKNGKRREETCNGVRITRTFTIGRRNNILFRFLNYYSYAISSTLYVLGLKEEYDVIYTNQTSPIMMVSAAMAYAKKWKKKVVLYCLDLWPASLAAGGLSQSSPIYKFFGWVSKRLYRKADKILITSRMFKEYLCRECGVEEARIGYMPQYADACFDQTAKANDGKDTIDLLFAGNIGAAQSLDTVLQAAKMLEDRKELRWHIVGDGSELERLKSLAQQLELDNVIFHGRKPMEEMPAYYAMADAMLVTLTADPFISLTLPGKVQTYMAAGKPIIGAANGEIPNTIEAAKCGFCAKAEDAHGFAQAVIQFLVRKDRAQLGQNARIYYEEHYTRKRFMDTLEAELFEVMN